MEKSDIGLIGLAVMGANLARNISGKGFTTLVFNRTVEKMTRYIEEFGNDHLSGKENIEQFVTSLSSPRKIIIMVKAGDPVDEVIQQLIPLLEKNDTVIDCGNSHYHDTIRRSTELQAHGIHFMGCGVSGGEEGALHGPSLMPGGSVECWELMKPVWESIAAKDFSGAPCVSHIGEDGAGHYVKMVHNGIEYAVMQMIAEAYDLLKKAYGLSPDQVADIFDRYGKGKLESYLFEIAVPVLRRKDDEGDGYLIDVILDKAGQKGTGKWTGRDALDRGVSLSTITESVFARINSSEKNLRSVLSKHFQKSNFKTNVSLEEFSRQLESGLYGGMLSAYTQGFELIKKAAEENSWAINLSEIARIWQGGCIIRAKILQFLTEAYKSSEKENPFLLELKEIQNSINSALPDWRAIVSISIQSGIPTPGLTSALQYIDAMTTERLPANLIQGLRDYFGAHSYERTDKKGTFHTDWI